MICLKAPGAPKYARSFTLSEKVTLSDNFIRHFIWQFTLSDTLSDTLPEKLLLYPILYPTLYLTTVYFIWHFIWHFIWQLFTLSDTLSDNVFTLSDISLLYLRTWASNSITFKYELLTPSSLRERSKTRFPFSPKIFTSTIIEVANNVLEILFLLVLED